MELIARFEYTILVGFLSKIIHDTYIRKIELKKRLTNQHVYDLMNKTKAMTERKISDLACRFYRHTEILRFGASRCRRICNIHSRADALNRFCSRGIRIPTVIREEVI